jgi:DNA-binding transcriptional MerR regulator
VSHLTGLSIYTLRYYDELGLLPHVRRLDNGRRVFAQGVLGWIDMIKCLRATQMPLSEMQLFTQLAHQDMNTITQQRELLEEHRREIAQHMDEVEAAIEMIDHKIQYMREVETQIRLRKRRKHPFTPHALAALGDHAHDLLRRGFNGGL